MLVLTRKVGETVDIFVDGRTIEVTISHVKGNQVGLSFEADRDIIIDRREISDKKRAEKAETKDSG